MAKKRQLTIQRKGQKFITRLQSATTEWKQYMEPMLGIRKQILAHYASGYYQGSVYDMQPLNLIDRALQILVPFLVANDPSLILNARYGMPNYRVTAKNMELAMQDLIREIEFAEFTLRPVVLEAMVGMGVTKTGITAKTLDEASGYLHDWGQPFCDVVPMDRYISDIGARNRQECYFEGDEYDLPEEFVKESGAFKNYDALLPLERNDLDESASAVSKKSSSQTARKELRSMVRLQDIWLPSEGVVITLPLEGQGDKEMRIVEYAGTRGAVETGPYDVLTFKTFPDSIVPIPPAYGWLDMNSVINHLVSKLQDQAVKERNIIAYDKAAAADAERLRNASDNEFVAVSDTEKVKELKIGGVHKDTFALVQYLEQQYSMGGGNLYGIGGVKSMSGTLGQEQMLLGNASRFVNDLSDRVYIFTRKVLRKLMWYRWHDPVTVTPITKSVKGTGIEVHTNFTADMNHGDYYDYALEIEPYSMQKMTPELRYQKLMDFVQRIILPTAQMAAAQGVQLNIPELTKEFGRYLDIRNMDLWYVFGQPNPNVGMNAYQPNGSGDGNNTDNRLSNGQGSDNMNNMLAASTKAAGTTTGGM